MTYKMTELDIKTAIKETIGASNAMGTAWLMSNGNGLTVAYTDGEKKLNEKHGFWVASIYENGHMVHA